jgi:antirestriction protein
MSECRIYVASLADYNAGRLHGEWIDVTDPTTMRGEITAMLAASPTAKEEGRQAEEWAVHDYEGFDGVRLSETPDLETLCSISEGVDEHGDAFLTWVGHDPNHNTDKTDFEEVYRGEFASLADYVEDWWDQSGWSESGEGWWHPSRYVDWERMGHDLEMSGDIFTVDAPGGRVWVFDNH